MVKPPVHRRTDTFRRNQFGKMVQRRLASPKQFWENVLLLDQCPVPVRTRR